MSTQDDLDPEAMAAAARAAALRKDTGGGADSKARVGDPEGREVFSPMVGVPFEEHATSMRYFAFAHLPPQLQEVSRLFHDVACQLLRLPVHDRSQLTIALQRLLESKDAAVRAMLKLKP